VAEYAVAQFETFHARDGFCSNLALAEHAKMYLGADLDLPFERDVSEPLRRLLDGHGFEHAKFVSKMYGFFPEFEYQRKGCA